MDSKHTVNLKKFISKDADDTAEVGGVIYTEESVDKFKGNGNMRTIHLVELF